MFVFTGIFELVQPLCSQNGQTEGRNQQKTEVVGHFEDDKAVKYLIEGRNAEGDGQAAEKENAEGLYVFIF